MKKLFNILALMLITITITTNLVNAQDKPVSAKAQVQQMKKDGTANKLSKGDKPVKPVVVQTKKSATTGKPYKASKKATINPVVGP